MIRREKWSCATATHQQNGQHWGSEKGNQVVQNPPAIGTAVRSTCHTWLGRLAVTTRPVAVGSEVPSEVVGGLGLLLSIRPTVVVARCSPARASV